MSVKWPLHLAPRCSDGSSTTLDSSESPILNTPPPSSSPSSQPCHLIWMPSGSFFFLPLQCKTQAVMKSQESELMSAVRGNSQPCSWIALVQAITMYRNCSNIWQLTSLCQNQRSILQMNVLYSSDCGKHLYWCSSSKTILSSIDHRSVTVLAEPETWNFYFVLFVHLGFEPIFYIFLYS